MFLFCPVLICKTKGEDQRSSGILQRQKVDKTMPVRKEGQVLGSSHRHCGATFFAKSLFGHSHFFGLGE